MAEQKADKVGAVMVVGGGIAGIQASLDLAEMGYYVYLVEKTPAIGGRMAQLDKTFPTNDCSMCIISPKLNECGGHINIEVLTTAELLDVSGEPGRMKARVLQRARYIDLEKCTGCGDCAAACPVEVPDEFNTDLNNRKAAFKPYAQAYPNAFAIRKLDTSPCTLTCPAQVNAHAYVSLVAQGRYKEAMEVILEVLPLPGTLGRICPHPCEANCRRAEVDQALSIRDLKRLAADQADILDLEIPVAEPREERVAIVGSGPAGLAAAYHLARMGYKSTIFEALPVPGGMLRVGIPDYRLPPEVLEREVEAILRLGVEIKYETPLGPDLSVDDLFGQGFKAVYLALGAHKGLDLGVPGEEAAGVVQGVKLLREMNLGEKPQVGRRVAVIGGGNVAMDVSRSALRLGAQEVTIVYRRSRAEMPAWEEEVEAALEEGIRIEYLAAPQQILVEEGRVKALRCIRMELGEPDSSGRRRPVPLPGTEFDLEVDMVVPAIGQVPAAEALEGVEGLSLTRWGTIEVDPVTYQTGRPGVFAGGDMQTGPWVAIGAIAAGREAAVSIDRYFRGEDLARGREPAEEEKERKWREIPAGEEKKTRLAMPKLAAESRLKGFEEVELGFDPEAGQAEAARCLACGLCCECYRCVEACLPEALTRATHQMQDEVLELEVGSVVLCAGFDPFDPSRYETYQYFESPNVVSALEFERILSASGPSQGHLVRPSDQEEPKKIAWLQCVGSRDVNRCDRPYCSAVCCTYAIKEAIVAKEHAGGDLEAAVYYMDMRTFGKDFEKYYHRAQEAGVRFIRARVHTVGRTPDEKLLIQYADEQGEIKSETYDMVVLSVGLEPEADFAELAERLGVELTEDGFVACSSFAPVNTSRPGIYACGALNEPKDIPYSVMEASAAAGAAASELAEARFTRTRVLEYPPERDITGAPPRIGVFVCHCGINIGGVVDVPAVAEYAKGLPFVEYATENLFTCSQDTQRQIVEAVQEQNLNRVVVASCSPRTHEPMFQETLRQAGLNKYLFEMANIRDHNSWVHQNEPELATQKAKDLVRAAVAKASLLEPMEQTPMEVTKAAVVVGGGAAGMTAALALAEQGFPVHLIEKDDHLGGNALKLNTTWRGEDIKAFTAALIKEVEARDLIKVYLNSEIKGCGGFLGNFVSEVATPEGEVSLEHGAVVVATGGSQLEPTEYLYGEHERVLTTLEMDQALAEGSEMIKQGQAMVFIQCVGSREPERPYCSKICCTHSVESAIRIKELNPEAAVYVLYRDVRTYGFRERLYREARRLGVVFIRYDVEDKPRVEAAGPDRLKVSVTDHVLGRPLEIECDLLTLASAILPNPAGSVAEAYKIQLNAEDFFLEAHMKLRPVDFATDGIFLAGLAHYPKPMEESLAQARAAAARAATLLAKDFILVGGVVAVVDPDRCAVCLTCVRTCPYEVPEIGPDGHAVIEAALCRGCGACVSECPGKAITLQHFTDEQLLAKTKALVG